MATGVANAFLMLGAKGRAHIVRNKSGLTKKEAIIPSEVSGQGKFDS